uniref:Uncharacterized protein n=2 Tax=Panagrolaimus superbus TaxID=310955 RepID=A0A914YRP0_9BILA
MKDGPVEEAPPLEIVEIMCEDAIRKEEDDEDKYMNFDDEWLEKHLKQLENLEIIDFEAAVDPLIDEPIGDSDDEYIFEKPLKSKKKAKVKRLKETPDESEEEIMQQLTKIVERRVKSAENAKEDDNNGIQDPQRSLFDIVARRKASSPKRSNCQEEEPPEEDETPFWIPSPKKAKVEIFQDYLDSAPSSSKSPKILLFPQLSILDSEASLVSSTSKSLNNDSNAPPNPIITDNKRALFSNLAISITPPGSLQPPTMPHQNSETIEESLKPLLIHKVSQQTLMDTTDESRPSSSKPPTIKPISHHSSIDSDVGSSRPPMIHQISQHNSVDSEERPGSSPLEFLYKEQPPILERQVPLEENVINVASSPAPVPRPAPIIQKRAPIKQENIVASSPDNAKPKLSELFTKKIVKLPKETILQYPMPDFDNEPHLRQIFPYTAKLFDNQWDFEKNISFKDIGYADKELDQLFYHTPPVPGGPITDRLKYLQENFPEKFANILPLKHREKERTVNIIKEEEEGTPTIIERMRLKTIHIQPDVELLLNSECCNPMRGRAKKLKEKSRKKKKKRNYDDEILEDVL